MKGLSRYH